MNRAMLEQPFTPGQIRQRKGRNGVLDYVEGHAVIQRLNDALEGAWSFEIVGHEVREEEVLVVGKLSAGGIVKMRFGASQITRDRGSGQALSLGDDLKAAGTDCVKKCATLLGVGLHLYAEKPLGGRRMSPGPGAMPQRGMTATRPGPQASPGNGTPPEAARSTTTPPVRPARGPGPADAAGLPSL